MALATKLKSAGDTETYNPKFNAKVASNIALHTIIDLLENSAHCILIGQGNMPYDLQVQELSLQTINNKSPMLQKGLVPKLNERRDSLYPETPFRWIVKIHRAILKHSCSPMTVPMFM